jgi:hypothetical protein
MGGNMTLEERAIVVGLKNVLVDLCDAADCKNCPDKITQIVGADGLADQWIQRAMTLLNKKAEN